MRKLVEQLFGPSVICTTIALCFGFNELIKYGGPSVIFTECQFPRYDYLYWNLSIPFIIIIIINVYWTLTDIIEKK